MLIPASMSIFWTRARELEAAGARNPLAALVAIAGEIGWHVTQVAPRHLLTAHS